MTVIPFFDRRLAAANRIIAEHNEALAQIHAALLRGEIEQALAIIEGRRLDQMVATVSRIMAEG